MKAYYKMLVSVGVVDLLSSLTSLSSSLAVTFFAFGPCFLEVPRTHSRIRFHVLFMSVEHFKPERSSLCILRNPVEWYTRVTCSCIPTNAAPMGSHHSRDNMSQLTGSFDFKQDMTRFVVVRSLY